MIPIDAIIKKPASSARDGLGVVMVRSSFSENMTFELKFEGGAEI